MVALTFYFSRLNGLQANDQLSNRANDPYAGLVTVYQYEQQEKSLLEQINILKADYAGSVQAYQVERTKVEQSKELSDLEKREKLQVLESIYSDQFFARKLDLLSESQNKLDQLRQAKCEKFCIYQDLPGGLAQ